jgi:hypothetical protein
MTRDVKLVAFLLMLVLIFIGAHAVGSALGPVTTSHSQVGYTGTSSTGGTGGGMNMGGQRP